ncbi:MAG: spondin domain-containing protein [Vicinamibacterales bacterium]
MRLPVPGRRPRPLVLGAWLAAVMLSTACGSASPTGPTAGAPQTGTMAQPAPATARYRVTFAATWSAATHPQDFPDDPHFSPLVGATHAATVRFWAEAAIASDGIRRMAEQGLTSPLDTEIGSAIGAGTARTLLRGSGIGRSPGSTSVEFEAARSHPLLTLVAMVAPSPDWFVGVSALPLFDGTAWVTAATVDLRPWDAGTDGGRSYESADQTLAPRQPIAPLTGFPVAVNGAVAPLGRFVIERLP